MRAVPSSFTTGNIGASHLAVFTGWIIPSEVRRSSSCSIFSLKTKGTGLPLQNLGVTSGFKCKSTLISLKVPSSGLNTFATF